MGSRFQKRRRTGFGYRRRRVYGGRTRRPKMLRRFRRRYVSRRYKRRGSKKLTKNKLQFRLTEEQPINLTFGQQHTVPDVTTDPECVYFTVEQSNVTHTERSETTTRSLGGMLDVLNVADQLFVKQPSNAVSSANAGWSDDMAWGSMYLKGKDIYEIRNQSNETVYITAYICTSRQNAYFAPDDTTNNPKNIYYYLATGWSERGFDVNNQQPENDAMRVDIFTPFMSRQFCHQFKINKVEKFKIEPGKIKKKSLALRWRKYIPADLTIPTGGGSAWVAKQRKFDTLKGERFILFKLHGNVAGQATQTTIEKWVTQTTPTVVMRTFRRYWGKHFPQTKKPVVYYPPFGHTGAGAAANIIVDADEQKGVEIDAS